MRRVPLIAILLLCAGAMCCALSLGSVAPPHFKSAHAQVPMTGAGLGAPSSGGSESYAWINQCTSNLGSDTYVCGPISIPAGYVVVPVEVAGGTIVSITAGATPLNQDILNAGVAIAIYSGAVATPSSTLTIVTSGAAFFDRNMGVYVISNINTASVKHTLQYTGTTGNINVTAGDYMFAISNGQSFASSTQAPTNACTGTSPGCTITGSSATGIVADWNIVSTNASFAVNAAGTAYVAAATYH